MGRRQKEHKLWGRQHPAAGVGVSAPQAEVNLLHTFVSQLTVQPALCCHPCKQSLTSPLKANPNFNLLKNVSLAKASHSSKKLQSFLVLGFAGQDRKQDRDEACSKRLKRFRSKNEVFKRCNRSTTED